MNAGDLRGTIHGVVHPTGMSVYPGRPFWMRRIVFSMHSWRVPGQPVQTEQLLVVRNVLLGTTWRWRRRIVPGEVISFVSTGLERTQHGALRLRLSRFLGAAADRELLDVAASLLGPDFLDTTEFGRLASEPGRDYHGRCAWHGMTVELEVSPSAAANIDATLDDARTLLATWPSWEARLRALVTRELLPLWLDWNPDEVPIDGDTLFGRLTLQRIQVMDDGQVQLSMDAGGQFTDHEIAVDGTVAGGPEELSIEG